MIFFAETTDDASPSEGVDDSKDVSAESKEIQEEMGADGVTSEGEKTPNEGIQVINLWYCGGSVGACCVYFENGSISYPLV